MFSPVHSVIRPFALPALLGTALLAVYCMSSVAQAYDAPAGLPAAPAPRAPQRSRPNDDPTRFILIGSAGYQHHYAAGATDPTVEGDRIHITFEPTVSFLPSSITIDLRNGNVTQADLTLLRIWMFNLLSYRRNTDASVQHDLEFLRVRVPLVTAGFGSGSVLTNMVVSVSGEMGVRWLNSGVSGFYAEPTAALTSTTTILNRIFVSAFARTTVTGMVDQGAYLSGAAGGQISVGLTSDNMLRIFATGSVHYDGLNDGSDRPTVSEYLGAGLEWGAPSPLAQTHNEGIR